MTGEELKEARLDAKLTQQRLGELLGYTGRNAELMVQHWEHNRRNIPLRYYRKLAEILEIPLERMIP